MANKKLGTDNWVDSGYFPGGGKREHEGPMMMMNDDDFFPRSEK